MKNFCLTHMIVGTLDMQLFAHSIVIRLEEKSARTSFYQAQNIGISGLVIAMSHGLRSNSQMRNALEVLHSSLQTIVIIVILKK